MNPFRAAWSVAVVVSLCVGSAYATGPGKAAIASAHHLATEAGHEILAEGGNAFDAAVAVAMALAVVEPASSGIGGGGFFLLHRASDGKDVFVDAREVAPAAVSGDWYLDDEGKPDRDRSVNGPLAAGIPGQPAGLVWLAEHYGRLPLEKSLAPSIRLAEEGFHAPLDLVDGAARVYDPIVRGEAGDDLFGVFLKDYAPGAW